MARAARLSRPPTALHNGGRRFAWGLAVISFIFGVPVATSASGTFLPYLGSIDSITVVNKLRAEAVTSNGNTVMLRGDFSASSAGDLRGSEVTAFDVISPTGSRLVRVTGLPGIEFGDLDGGAGASQDEIRREMNRGFSLSSGATEDIVVGLAGGDRFVTGAGNDVLRGGAGDDRLNAGAGNDVLDGGRGIDIMIGGTGKDIYVVDNRADRVAEGSKAGIDTVRSSVHWTMPNGVEELILTGKKSLHAIGNAADNIITGNAGANVLEGRAGDDTLDGGRGADTLKGGLGDDNYIVDRATDKTVELANQGDDEVSASVSYTLAAHVEDLTLLGVRDINATGNALDNRLRGNAGDNDLAGGAGADLVIGGAGADRFIFAHSGEHADHISDFLSGTDKLRLDGNVFAGLSAGALDPGQFGTPGAQTGFDDFLVYDQASGVLSYDATGNGGSLQTIVTLNPGATLLATDIQVFVV
ncbi:MAG: calcium-binding protein [Gammaproteobacteria bacterium]